MSGKWGRVLDTLFDNYVFVLLILAQAALAQFGVANALSTGMVPRGWVSGAPPGSIPGLPCPWRRIWLWAWRPPM